MKPIRFSNIFTTAIVLSMAAANAGTPTPAAPAAAPEAPSNWATFTVGGAFVNGDEANMGRRTGTNNGDFYGGISDSHYGRSLDKDTTLTIDGHAMPGLEDYEFDMLLNREGLGYLKVGYDQFRTWYDASGGYTALDPKAYAQPFNDERSVDRGTFSLEAGLRMENMPEVTFNYAHSFRNGDKDSTCWGDALPTAPNTTTFKTRPGLWYIDETTDVLELDATHTFGNTDLEGGVVWEHSELNNTRYSNRMGTKPNSPPTPTATGTAGQVTEQRLTEGSESDLFAGHLASVTRFNDKAWLSFAASYSGLDSDINGGSRTYGAYWALPGQIIPGGNGSPNPGTTRRDYAYDNTVGGSNVQQFITNLNFMWVALPDLTITPSLRYENETAFTVSQFRAYNTNTSWQGNQMLTSDTDMDEMSEALDIRYKGIDNLVLYGTCEWAQEDETVRRVDQYLPGEWLASDINTDDQEYKLGANWYAMRNLSFGVEGVYGLREQSFNHTGDNQPKSTAANPVGPSATDYSVNGGANNLRPIMNEHDTEVTDFNLRATWRPLSNLSLVTRYDFAQTNYENAGIIMNPPVATNLRQIDSGTVESNIVSETITWNPMARMFVQGSVSWIWAETTTPMNQTTPNVDNDYITCGLNIGYALDDRTDITFGYNYYASNDYSMAYTGATTGSLGYGLETSEQYFSLGLNRALTDTMMWNLNYAYIASNTQATDQSGGFDDFEAHMISTGLQIRF